MYRCESLYISFLYGKMFSRESTGMNRKKFCEYFGVPYRTMTDWEPGHHIMPEYVLRLLAYMMTDCLQNW